MDGKHSNEDALNTVNDVVDHLPQSFAVEMAVQKYADQIQNTFNIILIQEMRHYNTLLNCIQTTAGNVRNAIKGIVN